MFSPDGASLGFVSGGALKRVGLAGGPPVTLYDGHEVTGPSWGTTDTLAFGGIDPSGDSFVQVPATGGEARSITTLTEGEDDHRHPELLPGGEALLLTVVSGTESPGSDRGQIAVHNLVSGERRTLFPGTSPRYARTGHVVFVRGAALWAAPFSLDTLDVTGPAAAVLEGVQSSPVGAAQFTLAADGTLAYVPGGLETEVDRRLVWVDRQGRETAIDMTPRPYSWARLSPDGRHVVAGLLGGGDLWIYDLESRVEEQLTFSGLDQWPIWSPDGSEIVFSSRRAGAPENLYVKAADGSGGVERLTAGPLLQAAYDWSADDETLVLLEIDPVTSFDIAILRVGDDAPPQKLLQSDSFENNPAISPDGRWIAYRSTESGTPQVYVRPFPAVASGGQRSISPGFGTDPLWGPDGRELFYRGTDGVMVVPVETGTTFDRGTPRLLFEDVYFQYAGTEWDIAPDGERFLMVTSGVEPSAQGQIIVIQNWTAELDRLVPAP